MSTEAHEITHIRDEDVLRNMWHRTEDFGRKKEIRAHMYRLREERLRQLYVADMDTATTQLTTSSSTSSSSVRTKTAQASAELIEHEQQLQQADHHQVAQVTQKTSALLAPSHENLLADQSYQSFKTKEVRDSESPTSDRKHQTAIERSSANSWYKEQKTTSETISTTKSEKQQHEKSTESSTNINNVDTKTALADKTTTVVDQPTAESKTASIVSRHVEHPDDNTEVVTEHRQLTDGRHVRTQTVHSQRNDANSAHEYHAESIVQVSGDNCGGSGGNDAEGDAGGPVRREQHQSSTQQFIATERHDDDCHTDDDVSTIGSQPARRRQTTTTSTTRSTNQSHDYFVSTLRSDSPLSTSKSSSPTRDPNAAGSSSRSSSSMRISQASSRASSVSPVRKPFYLAEVDSGVKEVKDEKDGGQRPPLQRSETYEERCRQILGMSESRRGSDVKANEPCDVDAVVETTDTEQEERSESKRTRTTTLTSVKSTPLRTTSPKRIPSRPNSPTKTNKRPTPSNGPSNVDQPHQSSVEKPSRREPSPTKTAINDQTDRSSSSRHISSATIVLSPSAKRRVHKPIVVTLNRSDSTAKSTTTTTSQQRRNAQPVTERKESAPVYSSKTVGASGAYAEPTPAKIVRSSTSDGVIRPLTVTKTGGTTKTSTNGTPKARPQKCIATKTLNLSAATTKSTGSAHLLRSEDYADVQIDIALAKSSREPSPNRIVPTPVSPDADTDGGPPRFPDTVVEPDDGRVSPQRGGGRARLSIAEGRCRITEVEIEEACLVGSDEEEEEEEVEVEQKMSVLPNAAVDADDPSLLSVQDKVLKVLSTVEEANTAPRPSLFDAKHSERLDSNVSGKITQFITIAENLSKQSVPKPFTLHTTTRKPLPPTTSGSAERPATSPTREDIADGDECLLSVSDKISRFTAAATAQVEPIAVPLPQKSPKLVATIERKLSRQQSHDQRETDVVNGNELGVEVRAPVVEKQPAVRRTSAELQRVRSIFERKSSTEEEVEGVARTKTSWERSSTRVDRNVDKDLKLTDIGVFKRDPTPIAPESPSTTRTTTTNNKHYKHNDNNDISAHVSPVKTTTFEEPARTEPKTVKKDLSKTYAEKEHKSNTVAKAPSPDKIVLDLRRVNSFNRRLEATEKSPTPTAGVPNAASDKPSYMSHTVCSLEHIRRSNGTATTTTVDNGGPESPTKAPTTPSNNALTGSGRFDAQLNRSPSMRTAASPPRRKSSTSNGTPTAATAAPTASDSAEIEDIFDVTILQTMLETVVGYEQRRRIRAQIRVAKRRQEDELLANAENRDTRRTQHVATASVGTRSKISATAESVKKPSIETTSATIETFAVPTKKTPSTPVATRKVNDADKKPVWATQNILKKASTEAVTPNVRRLAKKTTTTASSSVTSSATSTGGVSLPRTQPMKRGGDLDEADCVTSSYGIGPTDEEGKPLFGISALKRGSSGRNFKVPAVVEPCVMVDEVVDLRSSGKSMFGLSALRRNTERNADATVDTIADASPAATANIKSQQHSATSSSQSRTVHTKDGRSTVQQHTTTSTSTSNNGAGQTMLAQTQSATRVKKISHSSLDDFAGSKPVVAAEEPEEDGIGPIRSTDTRSFLNTSGSKVTGFRDVMERMQNADNVREDGETDEDQAARALLNKFLGASLFLTGMESMGHQQHHQQQQQKSVVVQTKSDGSTKVTKTASVVSQSTAHVKTGTAIIRSSDGDLQYLKQILEESTDYEERRKIRAQIRQIMADKKATTSTDEESVVSLAADLKDAALLADATDADAAVVAVAGEANEAPAATTDAADKTPADAPKPTGDAEPSVVETATAAAEETVEPPATAEAAEAAVDPAGAPDSVKSSETIGSTTTTSTTTAAKTETQTESKAATAARKPISPLAKFKQLEQQSSTNSTPSSPGSPTTTPVTTPTTPKTPGGSAAPLFRFTDPVLNARAATIKDILLQWCQSKTTEYENVKITNFSTAWSDGLAFCALIHHFYPDAFDYTKLTDKQRRHNFTLAFRVADEKAGIAPLLDVEDMVVMRKPDWKCVFTYVQSIHRRFRNVE